MLSRVPASFAVSSEQEYYQSRMLVTIILLKAHLSSVSGQVVGTGQGIQVPGPTLLSSQSRNLTRSRQTLEGFGTFLFSILFLMDISTVYLDLTDIYFELSGTKIYD